MSDVEDLDAELLALAESGDESDKADDEPTKTSETSSPPRESPPQLSIEDSASIAPRRGVAKKMTKAKGGARKRKQADSDEDGEV